MKLLMTTDTVGGVWHYALSLCAALPGIEIVLATLGGTLAATERLAAGSLANVILAESEYRLEWMEDCGSDVAESGRWMLALAERHGVDLVHINGYAHAALPFGRPVVAVAHSDVLSWFASVKGETAPPLWDRYRNDAERGLRQAAAVIAPTQAVRRDLTRNFGLAQQKCRVIPNAIALDRYRPRPKRPVILSAGRIWDEAKNLEQLDRIAPKVAWRIEIAGEARHPDHGDPSPRACGGCGAVTRLGLLGGAEMASRLATAAIYAAPARYEPFGLAILEAAASGCALVLGDIPSLRENWDGAARFVPPDDDMALASALNLLIDDTPARLALAERAFARSRAFDIGRTAAEYARVYRAVAARKVLADA